MKEGTQGREKNVNIIKSKEKMCMKYLKQNIKRRYRGEKKKEEKNKNTKKRERQKKKKQK